jgi:hypothetical protein
MQGTLYREEPFLSQTERESVFLAGHEGKSFPMAIKPPPCSHKMGGKRLCPRYGGGAYPNCLKLLSFSRPGFILAIALYDTPKRFQEIRLLLLYVIEPRTLALFPENRPYRPLYFIASSAGSQTTSHFLLPPAHLHSTVLRHV